MDHLMQLFQSSFTKYTLAVALHVRPDKIQDWIARGWLKAREVEIGQGNRKSDYTGTPISPSFRACQVECQLTGSHVHPRQGFNALLTCPPRILP
jgi:hypothetical protein